GARPRPPRGGRNTRPGRPDARAPRCRSARAPLRASRAESSRRPGYPGAAIPLLLGGGADLRALPELVLGRGQVGQLERDLDARERLRHGAVELGPLGRLAKLVVGDLAVERDAGGELRAHDADADLEPDRAGHLDLERLPPAPDEAGCERHRVARRMSGGEELLGARLPGLLVGAAR